MAETPNGLQEGDRPQLHSGNCTLLVNTVLTENSQTQTFTVAFR